MYIIKLFLVIHINEGKDVFGLPKSNKRKSPFPNEEIIINNILYKNIYYLWKAVQKGSPFILYKYRK